MAPLRLLSTPPSEADYVPLSTHQAETPDSFYDGPPVLHLHQKGCVLLKTRSALEESRSPLASWWGPQAPSDGAVNGDGDAPELPLVRRDVDVLVASECVFLYSSLAACSFSGFCFLPNEANAAAMQHKTKTRQDKTLTDM